MSLSKQQASRQINDREHVILCVPRQQRLVIPRNFPYLTRPQDSAEDLDREVPRRGRVGCGREQRRVSSCH